MLVPNIDCSTKAYQMVIVSNALALVSAELSSRRENSP